MTKQCLFCGKRFKKPISESKYNWLTKHKFCSQKCHYAYGHITKICPICGKSFTSYKSHKRIYCSLTCSNRADRGGKIILKCIICGKKFTPKKRGILGRNTKYCSKICQSIAQSGRNHWNWKGGISKNHRRETKEYIEWRNNVYCRDNWTCQDCGQHCDNKNIVAHHLKSWNNFPELRYIVSNGIVLCRSCHKIRHSKKEIITSNLILQLA